MFTNNLPTKYVKAGLSKKGYQRVKCLETNKIVQLETTRVNPYIKLLCVFMVLRGSSYRKISEIVGVSHTSVANWTKSVADEIIKNFDLSDIKEAKDIEIDELYTYLVKKNKSHIS